MGLPRPTQSVMQEGAGLQAWSSQRQFPNMQQMLLLEQCVPASLIVDICGKSVKHTAFQVSSWRFDSAGSMMGPGTGNPKKTSFHPRCFRTIGPKSHFSVSRASGSQP
jgi:hypothetical protein